MAVDGRSLGAEAARKLRNIPRIEIDPGLTDAELSSIEDRFGFTFCAEHREFLSCGMPVGEMWVDWRSEATESLRHRLAWPVDGTLFDVEHNRLWLAEWGPRPARLSDALAIARTHAEAAPRMVPIYSHRFLPSDQAPGHPVLSMMQTDIICYGADLADYIDWEFNNRREFSRPPEVTVPFWSQFF